MIDKLTSFSCCLLVFVALSSIAQQAPNILWITIEDTSPQFIGCYGNRRAKTPNIDKLAAEGIKFINTFSTNTVCSASRTTIITGMKTYRLGTGNHRSKVSIPEFVKGFPWYLKNSGYHTSNRVKTDYNLKKEKEFIKETWTESSINAGWRNRKENQPFFSVFNFMDSHQSRTMTNPYSWYEKNVLKKLKEHERVTESELEIPPFYPDTPGIRKEVARIYNSLKLTDIQIGELLAKLKSDGLLDDTIIFFFADHGQGMPRGKTNGIAFGYKVPFIVRFPEQYSHLNPWGENGTICDELIDFADLAPTILSLANVEPPSHLDGRAFLGKYRKDPPAYLTLTSDRSDNGIDMVRSSTDGNYLYSRNYIPYVPELKYIRYMEIGKIVQLLREQFKNNRVTPLQKSLFTSRPPEYLFDIKNDPWETENIANDPRYARILNSFRQITQNKLLKDKDVMFLPEYELNLLSDSTTTPFEYAQSIDYAIEPILKAASLSGFKSIEVAEKQIELLSNEDPFVRYWAIQGLKSQNAELLLSFSDEIKQSIEDTYEPISITAATICYDLFQLEKARDVLKYFSKSKNTDLALFTINHMTYFKNKVPFIKEIEEVLESNSNVHVRHACYDFLGSLGLVPMTLKYLK